MLRAVLEFVLILLILRALWRFFRGIVQGAGGRTSAPRSAPQGLPMARDPVCGTFVLPDRAITISDGRQRVHFCSIACRDKYQARTA